MKLIFLDDSECKKNACEDICDEDEMEQQLLCIICQEILHDCVR